MSASVPTPPPGSSPGSPSASSPGSAPARKAALRARYRRLRRELDPTLVATETTRVVAACLAVLGRRQGVVLASYLALGNELDVDALHRAWWTGGGQVLVPSVASTVSSHSISTSTSPSAATLTWHDLTGDTVLRPGAFGIREPDRASAPPVPLPATAAVIVPGVAFAADGRRLGQGAGYYDRALAAHRGPTIGVGFACQRCEDIPMESHDRVLDAVILGGEILRAPGARP